MRLGEAILKNAGLTGGVSSIFNAGGDPGDDNKQLTPQQMKDWNRYVDYVKEKGYTGSKDLDKRETGLAKNLFNNFLKENPDATIKYEDIGLVQQEMNKLKDQARAFAARRGDPNAQNLMAGTSKVDGWPGSKTTQFKFPEMQSKEFLNDTLVKQQNLGLVGGTFTPTGVPATAKKVLPKGVKLEKLQDGYYYEDPQTGDMVKWSEL